MIKTQPNQVQTLQHDKDLQIAVASSRKAKTWPTKTIRLSELVGRLADTTRTAETVEEYHAMPKAEQDEIKDVGGFVGGMLKGGRRKKESVANRQVVTLDADFADAGLVAQVQDILANVCWTIYSTHKHTAKKPRLRLLVYPDRPLLADEYQAVARRLAEDLGIDAFDDTTYDTNRLMYWPSTPSDGEYEFLHNDAAFLNVDTVLGSYGSDEAWQDASRWPQSSRETKTLTRKLKKQQNPLEKKGIVGAFCRVVSIHQALEQYLADVYQPVREGERYTYLDGSTSGGLVIYEDLYAYSNHGTDPASGQLCNAFDLIRIHRFGELDENAADGTPAHRLPSYAAMAEWAAGVDGVQQDRVQHSLIDDFGDEMLGAEEEEDEASPQESEDQSWLASLQTFESGELKTSFLNATLIMQHDRKLRDLMRFNEFSHRMEHNQTGERWTSVNTYSVRKYIGRRYNCDFPETKIEHAIEDRAHARSYHPVRDYLEALEWDGAPRVDGLFVDWLQADDNAYTREAAKCWCVAAVSRIMEPGYKFDSVPVISGPQGIGKTTFVSLLAKGWYNDLPSFDPKIAAESMLGYWILELNELSATNRHDLEVQKSFLSAQSMTVRMAYAKHPTEFKRQSVFLGTTNQTNYLKDSTGNRRFWPIDSSIPKGGAIDFDGLKAAVDQIWAEAFFLYQMGETTLLSSQAKAIALGQQEDKREEDEWRGMIIAWIEREASIDRYGSDRMPEFESDLEPRDRVCIPEIWEDCLAMRGPVRQHDRVRIGSVLDGLDGWERKPTVRFGDRFGRQRGWIRATKAVDIDVEDIPF